MRSFNLSVQIIHYLLSIIIVEFFFYGGYFKYLIIVSLGGPKLHTQQNNFKLKPVLTLIRLNLKHVICWTVCLTDVPNVLRFTWPQAEPDITNVSVKVKPLSLTSWRGYSLETTSSSFDIICLKPKSSRGDDISWYRHLTEASVHPGRQCSDKPLVQTLAAYWSIHARWKIAAYCIIKIG